MTIFRFFKMAAARHLGFWKFAILNVLSRKECQCAAPCQTSSTSVKRLRRYRDFTVFKLVAAAILDFKKSISWRLIRLGDQVCSAYTCQTLSWLANPLLRYGDFSIIQDGGRPPCWISKSAIFKVQYSPEYPCASPRQIRSKSVKLLRRYGDLTVFQNGGRRHLGFSKIQILNGRYVWEKFPSLC